MVAQGDAVRSAVVVIVSLWLTGCFYIDPINQRPSLDILQDPVVSAYRNEPVAFVPVVVDPDDHDVDLTWRAYMCTDPSSFADCDAEAAFTDITSRFEFVVPMTRADGVTPVAGMRIVLDGKDDHGAIAKPADQLQLLVLDRNPQLELRATSIYEQGFPAQYVVNTPINLYATYWDDDDSLDTLTIEWKIFTPMQVTPDFVDDVIASPPGKKQVAKILRPQVTGAWKLEVIVTDPVGNKAMLPLELGVIEDKAPCISVPNLSPAATPPGTKLPVNDPTLFQVPVVSDDLDSYPKTPGGSEFGEPTFVWSIKPDNGARQVISGATGSSTVFDPSVYTPGTPLELRVEIQDRKLTPVNCPDDQPACSSGNDQCFQRQTWRVEAQ